MRHARNYIACHSAGRGVAVTRVCRYSKLYDVRTAYGGRIGIWNYAVITTKRYLYFFVAKGRGFISVRLLSS